jgi:Ca-activated chloride channel family protein
MTRPVRPLFVVGLALLLIVAACSSGDDTATDDGAVNLGDPGDCVVVDMSVSSEKVELLNALARTFNESGRTTRSGECIFVRPQNKASGRATSLLADGWDEQANGPRPVIWSPASSSWGAILNQRLTDKGNDTMAPEDARPFMLTPLVIAMPQPMAEALGYPEQPVGFGDVARLARDPQGWATYGHPEWGPFRLGKTNPNFSTSGLSALIAQTYAGVGKSAGLSEEDLANPAVVDLSKAVESSVVHYGDITMTFLNNWFRADKRGTALTYASAVAIEEKSLIDYNKGNPDGVLDPGEEPRVPRIPLVAIYPSEGTLYSDNPFFILNASWVSDAEREAAEAFQEFVQEPENQERVLEFGFRPGNPDVAVGAPIVAANGVDPAQPSTLLEVPKPQVMVDLLDDWAENRKGARVMMVLDVSGSMAEPASPASNETKLDLAKSAAIQALDEFKADDEVGLRIFSTKLGPNADESYLDLVPISPIGSNIEELRRRIDELIPASGTPLLDVTQASYRDMLDGYDPARINAVLLLTDGRNEDGNPDDDDDQETALIAELRKSSTGEESRPVRIFTIAYGSDADTSTLKAIAEASNAAAYSAVDAASIDAVFTQVVSNF